MVNFQDWGNRSALLGAWKGRCAYCSEPLTLESLQVDHVVPERMPKGFALADVLDCYGLPSGYDVQSWENRAPACSRCNRTKSNYLILNRAPILLWFLRQVEENAKRAEAAALQSRGNAKQEKIIAKVLTDLDIPPDKHSELARSLTEAASAADAVALPSPVDDPPVLRVTSEAGLEKRDGEWAAYGAAGEFLRVAKGPLGLGWTRDGEGARCGVCGANGPWNGARCLTCGSMSDSWYD